MESETKTKFMYLYLLPPTGYNRIFLRNLVYLFKCCVLSVVVVVGM